MKIALGCLDSISAFDLILHGCISQTVSTDVLWDCFLPEKHRDSPCPREAHGPCQDNLICVRLRDAYIGMLGRYLLDPPNGLGRICLADSLVFKGFANLGQ